MFCRSVIYITNDLMLIYIFTYIIYLYYNEQFYHIILEGSEKRSHLMFNIDFSFDILRAYVTRYLIGRWRNGPYRLTWFLGWIGNAHFSFMIYHLIQDQIQRPFPNFEKNCILTVN